MDITIVFKIANNAAMLGWLLLLIVPTWKYTIPILVSFIIFSLAATYVFFIIKALPYLRPNVFNSLNTIRTLFANDTALLAGWIHYLAFDLFVGAYIVKQAEKFHIHRGIVIFLLPITFLFGPFGYLVFQLIKTFKNELHKRSL